MSCGRWKVRWIVVGHVDGLLMFSFNVGLEFRDCPLLQSLSGIDCVPLNLISTSESFEITEMIYFPYHPFQLLSCVQYAAIMFVYFLSFVLLGIITRV